MIFGLTLLALLLERNLSTDPLLAYLPTKHGKDLLVAALQHSSLASWYVTRLKRQPLANRNSSVSLYSLLVCCPTSIGFAALTLL